MGGQPRKKKLNNTGSAMILVLTILSLIAIMGALAMSTALLNLRMRGVNRLSDKNFYRLETALDEIYAQLGQVSSGILKEQYAQIMEKIYRDKESGGYETNDEANQALKQQFVTELINTLDLSADDIHPSTEEPGRFVIKGEENLSGLTEMLKSYSPSFTVKSGAEGEGENQNSQDGQNGELTVSVESVSLQKDMQGETVKPADNAEYSRLTIDKLCLTYVDAETGMESALTVSLRIDIPTVRFVNNGTALLDYVLVSNEGIIIKKDGGTLNSECELNGNIYGGEITIDDHSKVQVQAGLMTAKRSLTAQNTSSLAIGPFSEESGQSHVWANDIVLGHGSALDTKNVSLYVQDDMTLTGNDNRAVLNGNYYGFGNKGEIKEKNETNENTGKTDTKTAYNSSAILLNGKNDLLDLSGLDSLMLAGRAYLRFRGAGGSAGQASDVYPMGESLAVRGTQVMYLVPEKNISIILDGKTETASSNPFVFSASNFTVEVTVDPGEEGLLERDADGNIVAGSDVSARKGKYNIEVGIEESDGGKKYNTVKDITLVEGTDTATLVALKGKLYVYYNFTDDKERQNFFVNYLSDEVKQIKFDDTLRKSLTQNSETNAESGIIVGKGSRITTAGALYEVADVAEKPDSAQGESGKPIFRLIKTGKGDIGSSIDGVNFVNSLVENFGELQYNLAETRMIKGEREASGTGGAKLAPMGNYVKLTELDRLDDSLAAEAEAMAVYLAKSGKSVSTVPDGSALQINLSEDSAVVGSGKEKKTLSGGLIAASGDIVISGDGSFNGLIMAGGRIWITGNARLTADPETYEPLLEEEDVAGYFYDYSDPSSTVLNDYEDFIIKENWSRTGREVGGDS